MTTTRRTTKATATEATEATEVTTTEAPTPTPCRCGCGQPTVRAEAMYLPGHDARHAGQVGRAIIADPTQAEAELAKLPTDRLRAKAQAMLTRSAHRDAERAARQAAREAARAAYAEAMARA